MAEITLSAPEVRSSVGARRSEATETAVLAAFAELVEEVGYAAITMEAVAKRARAGKATVYRWWPTKAHLALALISKGKIEIPRPEGKSLRDDLIGYMSHVIWLWRGDGGVPVGALVRHCYAESWSNPDLAAALQHERQERWTLLNEILEAGIVRGELAPGTDLARAKDFAMSWPLYLLILDRVPSAEEVAGMVDDTLGGLTGGSFRRP